MSTKLKLIGPLIVLILMSGCISQNSNPIEEKKKLVEEYEKMKNEEPFQNVYTQSCIDDDCYEEKIGFIDLRNTEILVTVLDWHLSLLIASNGDFYDFPHKYTICGGGLGECGSTRRRDGKIMKLTKEQAAEWIKEYIESPLEANALLEKIGAPPYVILNPTTTPPPLMGMFVKVEGSGQK